MENYLEEEEHADTDEDDDGDDEADEEEATCKILSANEEGRTLVDSSDNTQHGDNSPLVGKTDAVVGAIPTAKFESNDTTTDQKDDRTSEMMILSVVDTKRIPNSIDAASSTSSMNQSNDSESDIVLEEKKKKSNSESNKSVQNGINDTSEETSKILLSAVDDDPKQRMAKPTASSDNNNKLKKGSSESEKESESNDADKKEKGGETTTTTKKTTTAEVIPGTLKKEIKTQQMMRNTTMQQHDTQQQHQQQQLPWPKAAAQSKCNGEQLETAERQLETDARHPPTVQPPASERGRQNLPTRQLRDLDKSGQSARTEPKMVMPQARQRHLPTSANQSNSSRGQLEVAERQIERQVPLTSHIPMFHLETERKKKKEKEKSSFRPTRRTRPATDEKIRRALSEFFVEGEERTLQRFCQGYSRLVSVISREVDECPRLRMLLAGRAEGEAFTEEDARRAMDSINDIYSCDPRVQTRKRKRGREQQPRQEQEQNQIVGSNGKAQFPPLKYKGLCEGVQLKCVEEYHAKEDRDKDYLTKKANLNFFRGWRHKDCLFTPELDSHKRCVKCRSAVSHFTRRHPMIAKPKSAIPSAKRALLPKVKDALLPQMYEIRRAIENRLATLEEVEGGLEAATNDPQLALASKVMKLRGQSEIELSHGYFKAKDIFLICEDCDAHMLKRKQSNTSRLCVKCCNAIKHATLRKSRMENNKDGRLSHSSKVPFSRLTRDEADQRYASLKSDYKVVAKRLHYLEEKDARVKAEAEASSQKPVDAPARKVTKRQNKKFRTALLPWPYYINCNPVAAQAYSMPTTRTRDLSLPKNHFEHCNDSSSGDNIAKASEIVCERGSESDGKDKSPVEGDNMEEMVTKDIADEPLDCPSVGYSHEEEEEEVFISNEDGNHENRASQNQGGNVDSDMQLEWDPDGAVSPSNEDGGVKEGDSGAPGNDEENNDFGGHLV